MARSDAPLRDLTGAYALDALSDEELAGFLAYLETDEDARAEATQLLDTAALLGASVSAVPPPPGLRTRVFALAEVVSSDARHARPAAAPRPVAPSRPVASPRPVASLSARVRRRWAPALAAAAAVVVLAGAGVATFGAIPGSPTGVDRIRAASDVHSVREHADGGGTAEVVWSPSERRAAVTLHGLPELHGGRVYELWIIDDAGLSTRAGTVRSGDTGSAVLLDGRLSRGDAIGITVEPRGGSDAPTTVPIVAVDTA